MHHRRNRLVRTLGVVALVGLIAAACGSDDDKGATDTTTKKSDFVAMSGVPGVTDTEIHFSALGTSTAKNPLGECYLECFTDGVEAYFAYRNAEGGIYGRDLVLDEPLDDELGNGQKLALEITSKNDTLATFLVPIISLAYPVFADANWPVYGYLTDHTAMANKTSLFSTYSVSAFDVPKVDHVYVAKAVKATKLGAIGYNATSSQTCVDQIANEFKGEYADTGISVVYSNKDLPFGLANGVGPEVTAMKRAGVELVLTCMEANGLKTFASEMKRQDLAAPLVTFSVFEEDFVKENASVLEGSIEGLRLRPAIATPSKGQKLFNEWTEKTSANVKATTYQGWAAADEMFQGLTKAGAPFDRQKLVDGTNSLEQWTADGIVAPVDVGRQHVGMSPDDPSTHGDKPNCFSYVQIKGGELTFLPPATKDKPYVCWEGGTFEYTEPTARSFGDD